MFFQGLCERRTKLRGSTYHNWRRDSIFLFFKFSSPFSQMTYCWKGDKSNLPKNQYKTKLYSHQTSSVLNEYIKYHTAFCILDLYAVYRGVLPPNLSSYALMYEIYIYIYIYIQCYHKNNVPSWLSPRWLYGNSCTHMSCHKAIVPITERAHCFHDKIYIIVILLL